MKPFESQEQHLNRHRHQQHQHPLQQKCPPPISSSSSRSSVLLDVGSGTMGQLRRRFGRRGSEAVLRSLQLVWVSHKHADHCMGLGAVLFAYSDAVREEERERERERMEEQGGDAEGGEGQQGGNGRGPCGGPVRTANLNPALVIVGPSQVHDWLTEVRRGGQR